MSNVRFSFARSAAVSSFARRGVLLIGCAACLLWGFSAAPLRAVEYVSNVPGQWTSPGTWLVGGSPTANVPGVGDNIIIHSGRPVTVPSGQNLFFGDPLNPSELSVAMGNNPSLSITSGSTLTQVAGSTLIVGSGANAHLTGGGTWINNGTIEIRFNRLLMHTGAPTIDNNGTLLFTEGGASLGIGHDALVTPVFNNLAGGTIRALLPNGGLSATINRPHTAGETSTLNNVGTVEVLRGILNIANTITVLPQLTGGGTELSGGTWRVVADGANSTLNVLALGATTDSITTINPGAKVVLSSENGGVANFPQLGDVSSLGGAYYAHGNVIAPVSSTLNATGTIGGDGEFNANGGGITITGGTLDPSALDGGAGTLTIDGDLTLSGATLAFSLGAPGTVGNGVNDLVLVNGALDVQGTLQVTQLDGFTEPGSYRLFEYTPGELANFDLALPSPYWSLDLSVEGIVTLNVEPVPEPSTGLLFAGLALAGVVRRRRRK